MNERQTTSEKQAEVNMLIQHKKWLQLANHPTFLHVASQQHLTALIGKLEQALPTLPQGLILDDHDFAILHLRSILKKRAVSAGPVGNEAMISARVVEKPDTSRRAPLDREQYIAYLEDELTRAEEGLEELQAVNETLTKPLELARAFLQEIPMTIESTFNCPKCNALQQAKKDNLSSVFCCSSCGHTSKYTFGELDWFQYRREHPDMPMPPPPVETPTVPAPGRRPSDKFIVEATAAQGSVRQQQRVDHSKVVEGGTMNTAKMMRVMTHLEKASKHRRVGEWDAAIQDYTVAINLMPMNFIGYSGRGLAFNGKGNESGDQECFRFAVADFTTAIDIGSDDPGLMAETHYNRGCVFTDDLRQHEEAIKDFRRALELDPGHYGVQQGLQRAANSMAK